MIVQNQSGFHVPLDLAKPPKYCIGSDRRGVDYRNSALIQERGVCGHFLQT